MSRNPESMDSRQEYTKASEFEKDNVKTSLDLIVIIWVVLESFFTINPGTSSVFLRCTLDNFSLFG